MTSETKRIKILIAMNETKMLLIKAEKRYNDTLECIARDESEGFTVQDGWITYRESDKKKVDQLKAHIEKLNGMLSGLAT